MTREKAKEKVENVGRQTEKNIYEGILREIEKKRDVNGLGGSPGVHSTGVSNTSTRLIGAFHPPGTQQHSHSCKPREICWRKINLGGVTVNVCVCFCEFKGMFTCLSQTTWGKKEGRAKGAKLGLSFSLFMCLSSSLSPLQIVTRSTENISRDFLPFKTKSSPPFPLSLPPSAF